MAALPERAYALGFHNTLPAAILAGYPQAQHIKNLNTSIKNYYVVGIAMTQPRTTKILTARNASGYFAIGSLLLFVGIDIGLSIKYPAPPPVIFWNLQFLAAGLIFVVALPVVLILRRKGF